ncbi:unnamed protein product [Linum trigynum]|uniref:Uncharacterized protein n=1 Tax=Linum trigynum TaxID=586398 RepID=A0AAV2DV56_9ROSI
MYALITMPSALEDIQLGSGLAISFTRVKGHMKCLLMHRGPYITRIAGHLRVPHHVFRCVNRTKDFLEETLAIMGMILVVRDTRDSLASEPSNPPPPSPRLGSRGSRGGSSCCRSSTSTSLLGPSPPALTEAP